MDGTLCTFAILHPNKSLKTFKTMYYIPKLNYLLHRSVLSYLIYLAYIPNLTYLYLA
jgi:hypothetical protein